MAILHAAGSFDDLRRGRGGNDQLDEDAETHRVQRVLAEEAGRVLSGRGQLKMERILLPVCRAGEDSVHRWKDDLVDVHGQERAPTRWSDLY